MQALGVKRYSYPFDWVRSPAFGIIHCLETGFADFLTFTVAREEGQAGHLFGKSHWGGSFWHHNPEDPKTCADFTRRAERLYGLGEVPPEKPRFFGWAINSTNELDEAVRLHSALKRALPQSEVYLLVLIDLQRTEGAIRLAGPDGKNLLFCRIHEGLFADNGAKWTMQLQSEAYASAMAYAINVWAGAESLRSVPEARDLAALRAEIEPFDGGSAGMELFFPRRFFGQSMQLTSEGASPRTQQPQAQAVRPNAGANPYTAGLQAMAQTGLTPLPATIVPDYLPAPVRGEMYWSPWRHGGATGSREPSPLHGAYAHHQPRF